MDRVEVDWVPFQVVLCNWFLNHMAQERDGPKPLKKIGQHISILVGLSLLVVRGGALSELRVGKWELLKHCGVG